MSSNEQTLRTRNQAITNYNIAKIFIGNNRFESDNYINNSSYDPITLPVGTLMGRIAASNVLVPCKSDASDGSQYPLGVLAEELIVDSGDTIQGTICVAGDVVKDLIVFAKPGDGMDTLVSSRRYKDRIGADTVGIKLVESTDLTGNDNQ